MNPGERISRSSAAGLASKKIKTILNGIDDSSKLASRRINHQRVRIVHLQEKS
jgi:hypothetical protein